MSKPTSLIDELRSSNVEAHVGDHRLPGDLDRLIPEVVLVDEALARDDRARARRRDVGEHCSFVSGSWIIFASLIS